MPKKKEKLIIYQTLVRLHGNMNATCRPWGTKEENGCGKMSDFDEVLLRSVRQLGCNCIWYTGLLQQATQTDYSAYGIPRPNPQVVKGVAGSPYAITDYYSVSCDLADEPERRMEEFDALVERTHKVGLKVIIDFVPNHVARQYRSVSKPAGVRDLGEGDDTGAAFSPANNFYYIPGEPLHLDHVGPAHIAATGSEPAGGTGSEAYVEMPAKATGNDVFHAWPGGCDWYETVKLNYGVDYQGGGARHFDPIPATWVQMRDILLYWAARGVNGFRCDMAFMVPVEFWHWAIPQVKARHRRVFFIAEIYDPGLYRSYIDYGGFDYLYDKVGLYDTLRAVVECRESASAITRCWQSVDGIQDHMLHFLENHDEQRIASDYFAGDPVKARPAAAVAALMSTGPYMNYFGQELGERGMDAEGYSGRDGRTTIFDYWSLPTMRAWHGAYGQWRRYRLPRQMGALRDFYTRLYEIAAEEAIVKGSFYDLMYAQDGREGFDIHRTYAFMRATGHQKLLIVANFSAEERTVSVNVPDEAWRYVGITSGKRHVVDLMTGAWDFIDHDTTQPMMVKVGAYAAAVLNLKGK